MSFPRAGDEFLEAFKWYEERLPRLGESFMNCVDAKLKRILARPLLFPKKRGHYREATIDTFPYLIVFKIYPEKEIIFISSIYHTSRHPGKKYRK